jgi:hypothetical protein
MMEIFWAFLVLSQVNGLLVDHVHENNFLDVFTDVSPYLPNNLRFNYGDNLNINVSVGYQRKQQLWLTQMVLQHHLGYV